MKTSIMLQRRYRWLLAGALTVAVQFLVASTAVAEGDHLVGYKVKDVNKVKPPASSYTLTNLFGSQSCELKKAQFFLVHSEKNGGDDPRGGPSQDFVCYKAKCTGPLPPQTDADSQFGIHSLETKKTQLVCLPSNASVCGDGNVDPGETCDGAADAACPGKCAADCTCPACAGQVVGGYCWFLGAAGATCDATCAAEGLTCDPATATYAGSEDSSDLGCSPVLTALGVTDPYLGGTSCGSIGIGCVDDTSDSQGKRCKDKPTDCASSTATTKRACACE